MRLHTSTNRCPYRQEHCILEGNGTEVCITHSHFSPMLKLYITPVNVAIYRVMEWAVSFYLLLLNVDHYFVYSSVSCSLVPRAADLDLLDGLN